MSRRRRAEKREIAPDPVYNSKIVSKFVNKLMWGGGKSVARAILYKALEKLSQKINTSTFNKATPLENTLAAFEQALENAKPTLEVKTRRIGGANYQVPVEIPSDRRIALAMQWIIQFSREKKGKAMEDKLAQELIDCFNHQGTTIKKKDDTHRMAEANKAFAHLRF